MVTHHKQGLIVMAARAIHRVISVEEDEYVVENDYRYIHSPTQNKLCILSYVMREERRNG